MCRGRKRFCFFFYPLLIKGKNSILQLVWYTPNRDLEIEISRGRLDGRVDEDKVLYVVTSGNGEEFFEHGAAGHGTQLYDETVRVPLLVRGTLVEKTGKYDTSVGLIGYSSAV